MKQIQVARSHYQFKKYISKDRWISIWHQIDEVARFKPNKVLEIGPGSGIFKKIIENIGIFIETVDIDAGLQPDYIASATKLPFQDNSYDCVCAFEVLEHLPYELSLQAFQEMVRVAKNNVIISLPNSKILWYYSLYIPKIGDISFHLPKPILQKQNHKFDGEHYWEINKKGYSVKKIIGDFRTEKIILVKNYRINENSYHHFFVFEKKQ